MNNKAQKTRLRAELLHTRNHMPNRQACVLALQNVLRTWLLGRSDTCVAAYWPIKGEFDPLPALHRWKEDGDLMDDPVLRRIALPIVDAHSKTMRYHHWYPGCPMENDEYGIPKPKDTEVVSPTLIIVPCLGYSRQGYRLGYGGGYFDRFLSALNPRPYTVGLGFAHGLIENFALEEHDIPLDAILNENGKVWGK